VTQDLYPRVSLTKQYSKPLIINTYVIGCPPGIL
jgi:hypothetical protein